MTIIPHYSFRRSIISIEIFFEDIALILTLGHEVVIFQTGVVHIKAVNSWESFIKNSHDSI